MTDGHVLATTTAVVALNKVRTHPRNVRQGDVGAISESLKAHGQYRPLVVQKSTGHILAGNHTYMAAAALGWTTIAVTYVDVDDDEALRILLVDNRTNDVAHYDDDALATLLQDLIDTPLVLAGTGYTLEELDDLVALGTFKPLAPSATPVDDLQDYLKTGRLVIKCPVEVLERFRVVAGSTDLDRLVCLLDKHDGC